MSAADDQTFVTPVILVIGRKQTKVGDIIKALDQYKVSHYEVPEDIDKGNLSKDITHILVVGSVKDRQSIEQMLHNVSDMRSLYPMIIPIMIINRKDTKKRQVTMNYMVQMLHNDLARMCPVIEIDTKYNVGIGAVLNIVNNSRTKLVKVGKDGKVEGVVGE